MSAGSSRVSSEIGVAYELAGRKKMPLAMTDDQIRRITVGELKPLEGQILLVRYDPAWSENFAREANQIKAGTS